MRVPIIARLYCVIRALVAGANNSTRGMALHLRGSPVRPSAEPLKTVSGVGAVARSERCQRWGVELRTP